MFNVVQVDFPGIPGTPKYVYTVNFYQAKYEHEVMQLQFRDWGVDYELVIPGSPIHATIYGPDTKHEFYGYVHHLDINKTPGKDFTEVIAIGGSFKMKKPFQKIYKNITADKVIKEIASRHNFVCYAVPHPRVYKQISQAGYSDWEFMVRLAKQCGYSLRTQNTELYFQPMLEDYTRYRDVAQSFVMRNVGHPDGSNLYSFKLVVGESLDFPDAKKAAVAVSGVDVNASSYLVVAKQKANKKTKKKQKDVIFDLFNTAAVVENPDMANNEAQAAEDRNTFPYRAVVEVIGDASLRPDMPVYLEGLGEIYSGYWTILKTEHLIVEEQRNVQKYTTVLHLGTDSLGTAVTWTDTKQITAPSRNPQRAIIQGVKQTVIVPKTALSTTSSVYQGIPSGNFGLVENKPVAAVDPRLQNDPTWQSTTSSLNTIIETTNPSPAVKVRLAQKMGLL